VIVAGAFAGGAHGAKPSHAVTLSPAPGTPDASPTTQISVLGARPTGVVAAGSRSGGHPGALRAYAAAPGASFVPSRAFAPGERVRVRVAFGSRHISYAFQVGRPVPVAAAAAAQPPGGGAESFVSEPGLHPPRIAVRTFSGAPSGGDFFVTPATQRSGKMVGQFGPLIADARGEPVWVQPLPAGVVAANLRPQTLAGEPVLTWWQGQIAAPAGDLSGEDVIADRSYRTVATVRAGNGYVADLHEFVVSGQTALITVYSRVRMDLSALGGSRHGTAFDAIVQRNDLKTGLVMFEWHALGHVPMRDCYFRPQRSGAVYDPYHVNSIQPLAGGDLLVSMRNTWTAYDLTPSGGIRWQLGGRRSSFRLGRGVRFAWQHDVQLHPGGLVSVFDNEGHVQRAQSRGLLIRLDRRRRTATLAHSYAHRPHLFARYEGNVQLLPGGDTLVGWGGESYFSEFSRAGRLLLDARFPGFDDSYRVFRYPWSATPAQPPAAAVRAGSVYASWNGATGVSQWRLLAGSAPATLAPVATVARAGFETAIPAGGSGPYFEVQALGAAGQVLGSSAVVHS